ncbi:monovalent cation:proton antiporter-2 (CPA2) family protein [Methylobacterium nonmethylotrophicum]|uniref:Potassium transporter TrkA n=1 Tax=Methylobacterium nonmethylotrophicum TaxID=1141884 RepID=A0A4Z0NPV4_9HYPH|nr:monovalent cation:proton antiporter-2 (CPA2) family protein [Methylobacterium nonmethylotrophicum]TGD98211.1 potassium transporter TrkA [Methylobacterium nonmethylotrophicum]
MATAADHASFLPPVLTFLSAAVIGVPIFRLLGQSAVLGYLVAGVVIGPSGLSLITEPETARSVSELGVVLLLFIVGLELEISRLISLRRDILGLGTLQLGLCALALGGLGFLTGLSGGAATVIGIALALSATAVALQLLEERRDLSAPYGQRAFAVLLFQDLSIVGILALLPLIAQTGTGGGGEAWLGTALQSAGTAVAAVIGVVLVGRYGLNPFFRMLAASGAREVMTAAALLVVLGTALLMEEVGLSMAMGAFLAGLLLAESNFRHQLEADIEPFRGMLLGLFFMSVGMSIDLALVGQNWLGLSAATVAAILIKVALVAGLFRLFGSPWLDALRGAAVLAPAGEFAFVLLPVGQELGLVDGPSGRLAIALAAITMLIGPIGAKALDGLLARRTTTPLEPEPEMIEGAEARVLVIGFGRFGHILNQVLLAQGLSITVIDKDVEQIRSAARFGFRVYYGDGTRLDVLRASGAGKAEVVCICIDDAEATLKIVDLVHAEFPAARTYVRVFDRIQAIEAMGRDVDYQIRETFESALAFGRATLEALGLSPEEAARTVDDVRKRDLARLVLQQAGDPLDRTDPLRSLVRIKPEPLTAPQRSSHALTAETQDIIARERAGADG